MQAIFETAFDAVYLVGVTILGVLMVIRGRKQYRLFGVMAVVLGAGDAFHLLPRAYALNTVGLAAFAGPLGVGKLITSVTMTVFYVLLYHVWRARYGVKGRAGLTAAVYLLAAARVALCLLPQNAWTSPNPPHDWDILRNVPFALLGALLIALYYRSAKTAGDAAFRWMWLTITLSFAFYLPVVLFADAVPALGALMVPKTCAYVWTVWIGYRAMRREQRE